MANVKDVATVLLIPYIFSIMGLVISFIGWFFSIAGMVISFIGWFFSIAGMVITFVLLLGIYFDGDDGEADAKDIAEHIAYLEQRRIVLEKRVDSLEKKMK
jgi:uncharacterized membrane protein